MSSKCQGIILALCNHFLSKQQHHRHPAYEYGKRKNAYVLNQNASDFCKNIEC